MTITVQCAGGVPDCFGQSGPSQSHADSPLVFKLDADPSEGSPLDTNSTEYLVVVELARMAVVDLQLSVKSDNISTVDYSSGFEGRVCCNKDSPICRCPWD
jgi:hypothetical protein